MNHSLPSMSEDLLEHEKVKLERQYRELFSASQKLRQRILELSLLLHITSSLNKTFDEHETFEIIKKYFKNNFHCDGLALFMQTANDVDIELMITLGEAPKNYLSEKVRKQCYSSISETHYYCADLLEQQQSEAKAGGSLLLLPLIPESDRAIGSICLYRQKVRAFSRKEINLLKEIAHFIAFHLKKIILYRDTQELAFNDALTGVYNRRYFDQRYPREIQRAERYQRELAVLMIDIDHFKIYNDHLGHLTGDETLRRVASLMESQLRKADVICRYGGEEFVVILPEIEAQHGLVVAEKLRKAVEAITFEGEEKLPGHQLTISIGVAAFPQNGVNALEVLQRADQALYAAKASGRNCVVAA